MVCNSYIRSVIVQAGHIGIFNKKRVQLIHIGRSLHVGIGLPYTWNREFKTSARMMVDSGATEKQGPIVDLMPEKEDDGGYVSGWWKSEDGKLSCGYSSFRGKRATMEDFYDIKTSKIDGQAVCMFGIFDGHGGSRAAEYLKEHLFENLMKHPQFMTDTKLAISAFRFPDAPLSHCHAPLAVKQQDYVFSFLMQDPMQGVGSCTECFSNSLSWVCVILSRNLGKLAGETYQQTDVDFLESEKDTYRDDGSTASTAVLVGNHLYVANVGDSRTIISKAGKAIPLSVDHKPNRSDERKRIESAGGVVMWAGTWRVGGVLAMSRAFGNRMLKQFVVAEPEIQDLEIDEEFELLVLASDGLWDVVPNEDAVSLARTEEEPETAARKLTEAAFTRGSADNITCIVVRFHHKKAEPANPQHN